MTVGAELSYHPRFRFLWTLVTAHWQQGMGAGSAAAREQVHVCDCKAAGGAVGEAPALRGGQGQWSSEGLEPHCPAAHPPCYPGL